MTTKTRAAAIRVDNVAEIRDVDGRVQGSVSIYLWQDGSYEVEADPIVEADEVEMTLVAAMREEIPPFDWIALLSGALAVVPAGSPAWVWLRGTGIWQRKTVGEIKADFAREVEELGAEMEAEKVASSERCTWCGTTATNHDHGKHMMPFCHGKKCQSHYWNDVILREDALEDTW